MRKLSTIFQYFKPTEDRCWMTTVEGLRIYSWSWKWAIDKYSKIMISWVSRIYTRLKKRNFDCIAKWCIWISPIKKKRGFDNGVMNSISLKYYNNVILVDYFIIKSFKKYLKLTLLSLQKKNIYMVCIYQIFWWIAL